MPTSDKQIAANRRNAERSTGPKSDLGKLRSSKNAIKHGIYSQTTVLFNEEQEEYDEHLQDFIARFEPQDRVELRLVQRMADCEWRLARARYIETATIDLQVDDTAELVEKRFKTVDEPVRVAFALQLLDNGQSAAYNGVQRQESRLHRQYERAYKLLMDIRKTAPIKNTSRNEPIFAAMATAANGTDTTAHAININSASTRGTDTGDSGSNTSSAIGSNPGLSANNINVINVTAGMNNDASNTID